jgi:hypothetical protein
MNSPLDPVRRRLGLRPTQSPLRGRPTAASVPGHAVEILGNGIRWFLGIVTALAGIVAICHQSLTRSLATAHGVGILGAAHTMLVWPLPLTQPSLAGAAAFGLGAIGIHTHGWRQITPRQGRYLLGFTAAAVLGAGPMVLLVTLTFVIFALAMGFAMVILLVVLARSILRR